MPPAVFEPAILAGDRLQTQALLLLLIIIIIIIIITTNYSSFSVFYRLLVLSRFPPYLSVDCVLRCSILLLYHFFTFLSRFVSGLSTSFLPSGDQVNIRLGHPSCPQHFKTLFSTLSRNVCVTLVFSLISLITVMIMMMMMMTTTLQSLACWISLLK